MKDSLGCISQKSGIRCLVLATPLASYDENSSEIKPAWTDQTLDEYQIEGAQTLIAP